MMTENVINKNKNFIKNIVIQIIVLDHLKTQIRIANGRLDFLNRSLMIGFFEFLLLFVFFTIFISNRRCISHFLE